MDKAVFDKNIKANAAKDLKNTHAKNEAKRLEQQVKSYKNSHPTSDLQSNNNANNIKKTNNTPNNSQVTNQLASAGLTAAGVPKGLSDKIVNSKLGQKAIEKIKQKNAGLNMLDKLTGGGNKKDETTDANSGGANFEIPKEVKKKLIISSIPILTGVIFVCLFMSASQIYVNSIGLGNADSLSNEEAESKIADLEDDKANEEIKDEPVAYNFKVNDSLKFMNSKLDKVNLIQTNDTTTNDKGYTTYLKRKYNEAEFIELEDFYSEVVSYSEKYDINTVYDFFFKLYYIYIHYRDNYHVQLDMPLLMATLNIQSDDMGIIFSSNSSKYTKPSREAVRFKTEKIPEFDYYKKWVDYKLSSTSGEHDIEILVQHMVSEQVVESCVDVTGKETQTNTLKDGSIGTITLTCAEGETYKTTEAEFKIDHEKYREFLKEFIEKKYFLNSEHDRYINSFNTNTNTNTTPESSNTGNDYAQSLINLANSEYQNKQGYNDGEKYNKALGYSLRTPWCANFVSWLTANVNVGGKSIYPDIIPFKSAGAGTYIKRFNSSSKNNIKFYYNDNCKNLKGKNGTDSTYTPKPGDFIFYDWDAKYYDISSNTQDHVALVEKYEKNTIYTIEGNMGNKIGKYKYKITDCRVIGFGSWY